MRKEEKDFEHWCRFAREWIAWARTPNHDAFWAYRDSFVAFLGRGEGEALEVGCGEGRVSRELKGCGYRVTAVDAVRELADAAAQADSAHEYAVASATALPFGTGSFDLVVAYNMLMDVEDLPGSVKEMRRVLRPDGQLLLSIVHRSRITESF
jgi:2-polyprenyl-3-methyl-5-hydroxy-6-metoxy-1,4-benzoquinol methylase